MENSTKTLEIRLSDEVIGHICQMIQLSLLTGSDVVDRMRLMGLTLDEEASKLVLSEEYAKRAEAEVDELTEAAEEKMKQAEEKSKEQE